MTIFSLSLPQGRRSDSSHRKENILAIRKRKKETGTAETMAVPQTGKSNHPFSSLCNYSPANSADMSLYSSLREAVPVIDAAIMKIVRLMGSFEVRCENKGAQRELKHFLSTVKVGASKRGIDSFVSTFFEQMLTFGTGVGEMLIDGKTVTHLFNSDLKSVMLQQGKTPLEQKILSSDGKGNFFPVKYPELILVCAHNPDPGKLYGKSIMKGLPFVSDILLKIYHTVGVNWERLGNVRFAVTYKPQNDSIDKAYAKERAMQVAEQWSKTMLDSSTVRDFVAVGDVSIKAIGADNQILDSDVPVRQMLEQIVAKLGVPPFLLGLNWSTTERMSSQQADILTSEIDAYRREITPVIERICEMWFRLKGIRGDFEIVWDDVTLQDIAELAQSRYYDAQAQKIISETGGEDSAD